MKQDSRRVAIGARLKTARVDARVTQAAAADAAGVRRGTVIAWEAGDSLPGLIELRALLELYGVTGQRVIFGEDAVEFDAEEVAAVRGVTRPLQPALRGKVLFVVGLIARKALS